MSLTLLKGLMPHVPQMLPFLITDPEMRSRAEETFLSPDFQENIEQYFVENIKVTILRQCDNDKLNCRGPLKMDYFAAIGNYNCFVTY